MLGKAELIRSWLKAVEESALESAVQGNIIPGFKIVESTTRRTIVDPEGLEKVLRKAEPRQTNWYLKTSLRPIGELERAFGKEVFSELSDGFVKKPQGKPLLVPEDDPRPAFSPQEEIKNLLANN